MPTRPSPVDWFLEHVASKAPLVTTQDATKETHDAFKASRTKTPHTLHFALARAVHWVLDGKSTVVERIRAVETLLLLNATQDAKRLKVQFGLLKKNGLQEEEERSVDVAFFPPRVFQRTGVVLPRYTMCPATRGKGLEAVAVVPNLTPVLLDHDTMCGHLCLLLFRGPRWLLTRLSDHAWVGLTECGCLLVMGSVDEVEELLRLGTRCTLGYGAQWVWIHAEDDRLRDGPSRLRDEGRRPLQVTKGQPILLQREHLSWILATP